MEDLVEIVKHVSTQMLLWTDISNLIKMVALLLCVPTLSLIRLRGQISDPQQTADSHVDIFRLN